MCDAKVGKLHMASLINEDVLGLYVTVDNAMGVRVANGVQELVEQCARVFRVERTTFEHVGKRLALNELHYDGRGAVEDVGGVGRHDVGMVEPAGNARLINEATTELIDDVLAQVRVEQRDLDGNVTVERRVVCAPDTCHGAASELVLQFVFAYQGVVCAAVAAAAVRGRAAAAAVRGRAVIPFQQASALGAVLPLVFVVISAHWTLHALPFLVCRDSCVHTRASHFACSYKGMGYDVAMGPPA